MGPMEALLRFRLSGPGPSTVDSAPGSLLPTMSPTPTQIMPSCMAAIIIPCRVLSLSPEKLLEFVNPPAILFFHLPDPHFVTVASRKLFIPAAMLPM